MMHLDVGGAVHNGGPYAFEVGDRAGKPFETALLRHGVFTRHETLQRSMVSGS